MKINPIGPIVRGSENAVNPRKEMAWASETRAAVTELQAVVAELQAVVAAQQELIGQLSKMKGGQAPAPKAAKEE